MNRRRFCLQKGGSQEHISLITTMFCVNEFAFNILPIWLENAHSRPKNWGFGGISPPKLEAISTKPPKGTPAGRNGSSGVLIMSVSSIVPEKSRGNKKCDKEEEEKEEEEERHFCGLFGIAVKWP